MGTQTLTKRISRATLVVGLLGIATSLFLISRLAGSWHIGPRAHTISILGQRLAYPSANVAAIAVLALALLGLAVTARALAAAAKEIAGARKLEAQLGRIATAGELEDGTRVLEDPTINAFCAGLFRPRVYVTTEAIQQLDEQALAAVLAHERHHARRHDPLRVACGRVLANALFFLPWLKALTDRHRALAELSADESAAASGRPALARAMLVFEHGAIDPERVDRLLGLDTGPAWRFPTALILAALTATATLAGTAVLAARFASGTATLAPPIVSSQPCIMVLSAVPAAVAFLGWRRAARMRAPWPVSSSLESSPEARSIG
jgi:Peptidase family M48